MGRYRTQARDTHPDAERVQVALWRRMTPGEKLACQVEMQATVHDLAMAGMRERHPGASERELFLRVVATWLDHDTMLRAYGSDPARDGG